MPLLAAKISKEAYSSQPSSSIDGYDLDTTLSKYNVVVYTHAFDVIIGFRGTAALEDIPTDLSIASGVQNEKQFVDATNIYKQVKEKYPDAKIYACGHSKGGSQALNLNRLFGIPVFTFNAGVGLNFISANPHRGNAQMYVIRGDPISALTGLSKLGNLHVYNSVYPNATALQCHSMSNFLQP